MATSTVEDYVKAIHALQRESAAGEAAGVRIAAVLGVTRGSVTSMVRKLCAAGLAKSEPYGGVRLTKKGQLLALDVLRRHRLLEVFLVEVLGLDWSEVHDEAERLEHAMSEKLLDRLDEFLGRPAIDPHGDPIPDAEGRIVELGGRPLSELPTGATGVIVRIVDQEPSFLGFVDRHGLRPGARVEILEVVREAESIQLRAENHLPVTLSAGVASKLLAASGPEGESGTHAAAMETGSASPVAAQIDVGVIQTEDYLRAILELSGLESVCRLTRLRERFGVASAKASRIVKKIVELGWAIRQPEGLVSLTEEGRRLAIEQRSRYSDLVEHLTALGVPRRMAQLDADGMEHFLSPQTLRCMRRRLRASEANPRSDRSESNRARHNR